MKFYYILLIPSFLLSIDANYSLESKYGKSDVVNFSEHILDINTSHDNGLYINTQFEYSNPPLFGEEITGLNGGYIDYSMDNIDLTLGQISSLYGRGLSINTYQDHTIDYDNRINGFEVKYYLRDDLSLYSLIGNSKFKYRQTPADPKAKFWINFDYITINGFEYAGDILGDFHILLMQNQTSSLGSTVSDYEHTDYKSKNNEINVGWNKYFDEVELYCEYSWLDYMTNDIFSNNLSKDTTGHRFYATLNTVVFDLGLTYEYKNYKQYGYLSPFSSPPIVYRESSSILASRNAHNMNFEDEIGHQLDINYSINENVNFSGNLSLSHRHISSSDSVSIIDVLTMSQIKDIGLFSYIPFRQWYLELNGWAFNEKLYYKIGVDNFSEVDNYGNKFTNAMTFPSLFTINFSPRQSVNLYLETQSQIASWINIPMVEYANSNYISITYTLFNRISFSMFFDDLLSWNSMYRGYGQSEAEKVYKKWVGYDVSYNITPTNQVSFFYGSQKGGLVCANGICAQQPDFLDGIKVTFRSLF